MWQPGTPMKISTGPLPLDRPESIVGVPPVWYQGGFLTDELGDFLIDDSDYLIDES